MDTSTHAPVAAFSLNAAQAAQLNEQCFCLSLDEAALARALDAESDMPGLAALVRERCPSAFAARPVFIGTAQREQIADVVAAIELVVTLPAYRDATLARAPDIARAASHGRSSTAAHGVFFGYDFHWNGEQLGLIEINTNAGGALLNAALARAQHACCAAVSHWLPTADEVDQFERKILAMFEREWRLSGRDRALRTIAIVDHAPSEQYLYPEFLLFSRLFRRHGLEVTIADPSELRWHGGQLWHGTVAIDLVYNRLCDFYLEDNSSCALRSAYQHDGVVLTPHPRAHALYADKRNLVWLSDEATLRDAGVDAETRELLLTHVPRTEVVSELNADRLWANRRHWFFKPFAGYGSRAAYRGDKLTRRVWDEIRTGGYVAQSLVAPGLRRLEEADRSEPMKFDLRAYAYEARVQWLAARLYRGQTTNFRTPGGGFAPVFSGAKRDNACTVLSAQPS